ncbi:protein SET DOMAIN GROUP 41 isoform X1 [Spinacia oleracea]|uniref:Protein SET DOMAIN GROUP 41 isoform X1 n=1 Tax=Spinacia oleracea TaxID=3562 RepID=A0A9R0IA39_SPIOL|nr:protein SET DOMAIN GROUP 41 isoform X1 [Spinacia oleracea]
MEMRAKEDIQIGQDITPPLAPLAFSLYNSSLPSNCSACFLSLSTATTAAATFLRYCSNGACSSTHDSSLHYSSAEHHLFSLLHSNPSLFPHPDSSDLRLSLRLLHLLPSYTLSPRFLGLLTNRHEFISDEVDSARVRTGASLMAMARAMRDEREFEFESNSDGNGGDCELEKAVLCLVITNAVEINFNSQRLGIGVYDKCFSWINHSCSPNSCYRFVPAFAVSEGSDDSSSIWILPFGDAAKMQMEDRGGCTTCELAKGFGNYGPRLIVRSIKGIQRGEEVTITYTELLQPMALRQSDLLLEYKFFCNCSRCSTVPQDYVDHALEEMFCVNLHKGCSKTLDKHYKEKAVEMLRDMLDSSIEEYMEVGDPVSCCDKVEGLLTEGLSNRHLEQARGDSDIDIKLSPLHYISLNAYTTLISTYKIRAGLNGEMHPQSFDMSRTSVAYSLLLACATHYLFLSDPSLIVSAATFWIDAGQDLLSFGRSPSWNSFANGELQNLSAVPHVNCPRCSLLDRFESHLSCTQTRNMIFNSITKEFHKCTSIIIPKAWSFLVEGCKYLKDVKDPIDFSWIQGHENTQLQHGEFNICNGSENADLSENESIDDVKTAIYELGMHCLLYGGFLSSICYGDSCSTRLIRNVICI